MCVHNDKEVLKEYQKRAKKQDMPCTFIGYKIVNVYTGESATYPQEYGPGWNYGFTRRSSKRRRVRHSDDYAQRNGGVHVYTSRQHCDDQYRLLACVCRYEDVVAAAKAQVALTKVWIDEKDWFDAGLPVNATPYRLPSKPKPKAKDGRGRAHPTKGQTQAIKKGRKKT